MIELTIERPPNMKLDGSFAGLYFEGGEYGYYLLRHFEIIESHINWRKYQTDLLYITCNGIEKISSFNKGTFWLRKLDSVWLVSRSAPGAERDEIMRYRLIGNKLAYSSLYELPSVKIHEGDRYPISDYDLHPDWCRPNGSFTWEKPLSNNAMSKNFMIWETPLQNQAAIDLKYMTGFDVPKICGNVLIMKNRETFFTYDLGMERALYAITDDEMTFAATKDNKVIIMDLE